MVNSYSHCVSCSQVHEVDGQWPLQRATTSRILHSQRTHACGYKQPESDRPPVPFQSNSNTVCWLMTHTAPQHLIAAFTKQGGKLRLDAYLAAALPDASRAKIQASIKGGLVQVNGAAQKKAAHSLRSGDMIHWALLPPAPCTVGAAVWPGLHCAEG